MQKHGVVEPTLVFSSPLPVSTEDIPRGEVVNVLAVKPPHALRTYNLFVLVKVVSYVDETLRRTNFSQAGDRSRTKNSPRNGKKTMPVLLAVASK